MNLFIDTPQWSAQRSVQCAALGQQLEQRQDSAKRQEPMRRQMPRADGGIPSVRNRLHADAARHDGEVDGRQGTVESYYRELEYADRRERRGKFMRVMRFMLFIAAIPVAVAVVFISSYALTLIANGATPEQVAQGVTDLIMRCAHGFRQVVAHLARG